MVKGHPKRFLGHNPLGGLMVFAMLAALSLTTLSGLKLYAVEEGKGPFAAIETVSLVNQAQANTPYENRNALFENGKLSTERKANHQEEEFWEEIHELGVNLMLALIILHIGGVILSSRLHKESLVKSMINGYKQKK